jgi:hypothetical protein
MSLAKLKQDSLTFGGLYLNKRRWWEEEARMSVYWIVFQVRLDIQTMYWNGSLEETRNLARIAAAKCEADAFQIFDFTGTELTSEKYPFQVQRSDADSCNTRPKSR